MSKQKEEPKSNLIPPIPPNDSNTLILEPTEEWQQIEPSLRMQEMNILFSKVQYKTPPSDQITLHEGYLEVELRSYDLQRWGVPEIGTYRFYFNEGKVTQLKPVEQKLILDGEIVA